MDVVIEAIKRFVQPGESCVDIGANVGRVTREMLKATGPGGTVLAVEPMPKWADEIEALKKEHPNLSLQRCGLAERPCDGWSVTEDPNNPGNGGLTYFKGDVKVPVTTLDIVMCQRPANFIKIDVEGMEVDVIMGGWRTLTRFKPVIVYESHPEFAQARGQPVFHWIELMLNSLGYKLYDLRNGELVEVNHQTAGRDTIAIP
jgi:FkbM family methyltransferase